MPERVRVQVDADDGTAVAEAGVGDERVDPGDVLRGRLVRRNVRLREIPVPALNQAGTERPRDSRLR